MSFPNIISTSDLRIKEELDIANIRIIYSTKIIPCGYYGELLFFRFERCLTYYHCKLISNRSISEQSNLVYFIFRTFIFNCKGNQLLESTLIDVYKYRDEANWIKINTQEELNLFAKFLIDNESYLKINIL